MNDFGDHSGGNVTRDGPDHQPVAARVPAWSPPSGERVHLDAPATASQPSVRGVRRRPTSPSWTYPPSGIAASVAAMLTVAPSVLHSQSIGPKVIAGVVVAVWVLFVVWCAVSGRTRPPE